MSGSEYFLCWKCGSKIAYNPNADESNLTGYIMYCGDCYGKLQAENEQLEEAIGLVQKVVDEQAEDDGLWYVATYASESYLQQALRKLHAAIEMSMKGESVMEGDDMVGMSDFDMLKQDYDMLREAVLDCVNVNPRAESAKYVMACNIMNLAARVRSEIEKEQVLKERIKIQEEPDKMIKPLEPDVVTEGAKPPKSTKLIKWS